MPEHTNAPDQFTSQRDQLRSEVNRKTEAVLAPEKPPTYSIEDVESAFGFKYTPEQKASLATIPFSKETLKACAGTHLLFPGAPLSLIDIREKNSENFNEDQEGEELEEFARATVPVRWHLLRMEQVPDSLKKTWDEQKQLLLSDEEVPSAAMVAFATMLHFTMTGQRLLQESCVRTSDVVAGGRRIYVSGFDAGRVGVYRDWDDRRYEDLGIASSRKF